jgi:outer membrane protein TolC
MPTLDLYGAYGASTGTQSFSNLMSFGDYWFGFGVVGLRLNVPIFDGLRKSKMIQQKKLQAEQLENNQTQLKQNIDFQILQAKTILKRNIDKLVDQRENVELADNVYTVTKIKYEEGVGSNIEVIEADATYKEAQINYYDAIYNALVAKIELEKAHGKLMDNQIEN